LEIGVLRTICLGWLWTAIFRISASQIARIISVSHWHLTLEIFSHNHSVKDCWLYALSPPNLLTDIEGRPPI
jgi:hypothetical protein